MVFLQTGRSQTEISDIRKRSKRIISREIRRNSFEKRYDPCDVQVAAIARREYVEKATK